MENIDVVKVTREKFAMPMTAEFGIIDPHAIKQSLASTKVRAIQDQCSRLRGVDPVDVRSGVHNRACAWTRHEAIFVTRMTLQYTLTRIAQLFDLADHSAVLHAINRVEQRIAERPALKDELALVAYFAGVSS
jgi:chromosomal replication initiation ATPase DnaA